MTRHGSVGLVNLPNLLTGLRLALVPVFLLALFAGGGHDPLARWIAGAVFATAAITDRYDGRIARKRGQVTDFGKIADPIADKALIGSALIGLSLLGDLAWWITIVIAVREVGVTVLRFVVLRYGVMAASPGGKIKTLLQIVAIGLYILPLASLPVSTMLIDWTRTVLILTAVALTIVTAVDYLVRAGTLLRSHRRAARSGTSR